VNSPGDRERWLAACGRAGLTPTIAVEVADWASALALVEAEVGAALIPAGYGAARPAGVAMRPLPWLVRRAVGRAPLTDDMSRWILQSAERPSARR
jgi:DNA-binding transcriptional LysR family regulator